MIESAHPHAVPLWDRLREISRGRRFIPRDLRGLFAHRNKTNRRNGESDEDKEEDGDYDSDLDELEAELGDDIYHDGSPSLADMSQAMTAFCNRCRLGVQKELRHGLSVLRTVVDQTTTCTSLRRPEPSWNDSVHYPLLALATRHLSNISAENCTTAAISQPFIPQFRNNTTTAPNQPTESKLIDYALVVQPTTSRSPLRSRITNLVSTLSEKSFNQTAASHLLFAPVAVSLETKADGGRRDEAATQIGVWVAAAHKRLEKMAADLGVEFGSETEVREGRDGGSNPTLCPMAQPVVLVLGDEWEVSLACDLGDSIVSILLFLSYFRDRSVLTWLLRQ